MYPSERAKDAITTQEQRQPQVVRACEELAKTAAALSETIDTLEKRLSPVLMSVPPVATGNATPKQVVVPLAESINGQSEIIYGLHRRLDSILSRLEV